MSEWEDDRYCIACGERNPIGMKLVFTETESGLETKYAFPKEFQGYRDTVHGGMLALLLDEIMVNLPWKKYKKPVVSFDLRVKLRKPLKTGEEITARAFFVSDKGRIVRVRGEIVRQNGELVAEGEAACMKVDTKDMKL
ncbi:MAG TPA: PaaI family thioesterase [Candidatus Goldiibacteriota bacterium]|nr:PaaI family thioesterase [Candidatus Goldiibacteriota bacterium]